MYDILILIAEKDFLKFRFVYDSIIKNIDGFNKVYCISNKTIPENMLIPGINYFLDEEVIDFDFSKLQVGKRRGWYVQQFIKLFQKVTLDDYIVVDSDIYINRKIKIIQNGKPSFLFGGDQNHTPYFQLMKEVFDLDRTYNHSFINEIMYFKREIISDLLLRMKIDKYGFFELVAKVINKQTHQSVFSEYELYGNYVSKYFPETYNYIHVKTHHSGKYEIWKEDEIQNYINGLKDSDYDVISMHTWV